MTAKVISFQDARARKAAELAALDLEIRQVYIAAGLDPDGDEAYWSEKLDDLAVSGEPKGTAP